MRIQCHVASFRPQRPIVHLRLLVRKNRRTNGGDLLLSLQHGIEFWITFECLHPTLCKGITPAFTVAETMGVLFEDTVVFLFVDTAALLLADVTEVSLVPTVALVFTGD